MQRTISLRYTLSAPARLDVDVYRAKAKRLAQIGRCPSSRALRRYQATKRFKRVDTRSVDGLPGANELPLFTRKRRGARRLKPGLYKVVLTARDASGGSASDTSWLIVLDR